MATNGESLTDVQGKVIEAVAAFTQANQRVVGELIETAVDFADAMLEPISPSSLATAIRATGTTLRYVRPWPIWTTSPSFEAKFAQRRNVSNSRSRVLSSGASAYRPV